MGQILLQCSGICVAGFPSFKGTPQATSIVREKSDPLSSVYLAVSQREIMRFKPMAHCLEHGHPPPSLQTRNEALA